MFEDSLDCQEFHVGGGHIGFFQKPMISDQILKFFLAGCFVKKA